MLIKEWGTNVKTLGDTGAGQFSAVVAVFGGVDSMGDVVEPGAFTDTLKDWEATGSPIPVVWSHDWGDPFSHIGVVTSAKETTEGLEVTGQLDMDNPKAAQVFRLMDAHRVEQFSFAYDVVDGGFETRDEQDFYSLRKLKLYEIGPTLVGANQDTRLLATKTAGLLAGQREGRVLSANHLKTLVEAGDAIHSLITSAKTSPPYGEKNDVPPGASATPDESQPGETQLTDEAAPPPPSEKAARSASAQTLARLKLSIALAERV